MSPRAQVYLLGLLLIMLGLGLVTYKSESLGLPIKPGKYKTVWTIEAKVQFQADGNPVKVSLALPKSQNNMVVLDEIFSSSGYGFSTVEDDQHARAVWTRRSAHGKQALYYKLDLYRDKQAQDYQPEVMEPRVKALQWSGSRHESLRMAASSLVESSRLASSDSASFATQLIQALADKRNQDGQLIKNGLPGKSDVDIVLDLFAFAEIPAHIIRGIYLEDDRSRLTPQSLIELYDGEHWQVFSPTTGRLGLPFNFLIWQRGDKSMLDVEGGRRSRVSFSILANDVPARSVALDEIGAEQATLIDYSIYSLPIEQQSIFKSILLMPVGALLVIFVRVVIGVRTAGTFMPVLLAIAFVQTSLLSGVLIFLSILGVGLFVRSYLSRLDLLLVARIAAVLVIVVSMMAFMSIISYKLGMEQALTVTFFPMIIIAWTIEHMSILWEDDGPMEVLIQTTGSLLVAVVCYLAMTSHYVEHWMFNFPELLCVLLGLVIILGHYTGYRLSELLRFRHMRER